MKLFYSLILAGLLTILPYEANAVDKIPMKALSFSEQSLPEEKTYVKEKPSVKKKPSAKTKSHSNNEVNLRDALVECNKIATPVSRLGCFDHVFMDFKLKTSNAPETIKSELDIGKWKIKSQMSSMDDISYIYMELYANNLFRTLEMRTIRPLMIVECSTKEPEDISVYIIWDIRLSHRFVKNKRMYLTQRFDKYPAHDTVWVVSDDRLATFHSEPIEFIKEMLGSNALQIQIQPPVEYLFTAKFTTFGFKNVVRTIKDKCGW